MQLTAEYRYLHAARACRARHAVKLRSSMNTRPGLMLAHLKLMVDDFTVMVPSHNETAMLGVTLGNVASGLLAKTE